MEMDKVLISEPLWNYIIDGVYKSRQRPEEGQVQVQMLESMAKPKNIRFSDRMDPEVEKCLIQTLSTEKTGRGPI